MTSDHPFSSQLSELSAEELEQKYSSLMNRWHIARRMGMDQNVLHQLDLLLGSIDIEKERRMKVDEKPAGVILDTDPIKNIQSPYIKRK